MRLVSAVQAVIYSEAQRVGSLPTILERVVVEAAAMVYFTKSQFENEIGELRSETLAL